MALFGSELLFAMSDREEILRSLRGRPHWEGIREETLRALIQHAQGDVLKISRFVFVSEYFNCVKGSFVDLARIWEDPEMALSAFGEVLVGLASDTIRHLGEMPADSERQKQAVVMVEVSYLSALLCNRSMLTAYRGLASLYEATGKRDAAVRMCRSYDEAERELLSASDEQSRRYRTTRYEPVAAALRADMDRLKSRLGIGD